MKLVVTGGAGFIGSNFIEYVLRKYPGYNVLNIDKLTYAANPETLKDFSSPNYRFVKADICDRQAVERLLKGCDVVVNFAAESHVDNSIKEPGIFLQTNVFGVFSLLEGIRANGAGLFIHISTDEVYGEIREGSCCEQSLLRPGNPYSASKASADMLALSYFRTYGIPVMIARSSNNYGPRQHTEKLLPTLIISALEDKPLPLYGDGRQVRDWLFVADNCRALDMIIHRGRPGEIYNVSSGREIENINMAKKILKLTGKPEELISFVADRPGHDRRYSMDPGKIAALGWKPETSLEEGLELTVGWYRKNSKWIETSRTGQTSFC